ncbi:MAG TPA: acyltransferase [Solirubrobacteraceae bacterium]|nr:acyltransferase [Solirubrobacteraceae bacterium]
MASVSAIDTAVPHTQRGGRRSSRSRPEPQRLGHRPVLDGLRGLAVLLVIALHVGVLGSGYIGVDMFFALSGFLITTLLLEEWEGTGAIRLGRFYARRIRRLAPALLVVIGAVALAVVTLDPFGSTWPLRRLVASTLLFVNNWVTALVPAHGQVLGPLVPTWSLAEEVQFYLLWPLLLWVLLRRRARPTTVLGVLLASIVGLLAVAAVMRHVDPAYNAYTSPFDRAAELLLGASAAILWRERLTPALLRRPIIGWLAMAGLALVLVVGTTSGRWWYLSAALLSALLIVNLLSFGTSRQIQPLSHRLLSRVIGAPPLRYVGRISYGVYLYHLPIYYLFWTLVPGRSPYFYLPIVAGLSLTAATLSWRLIEAPALRRRPRGTPRRLVRPARWAFSLNRFTAGLPQRTAPDHGG